MSANDRATSAENSGQYPRSQSRLWQAGQPGSFVPDAFIDQVDQGIVAADSVEVVNQELPGVGEPLVAGDAGYITDPQLAAQNLTAAAAKEGAEFRFRAAVTVVNAAGPWSGKLNELAGVGSVFTIRVRPTRQEVSHVRAPEGYHPPGGVGPSVADIDLGTYFRGEGGGGLLIGGTEYAANVADFDGHRLEFVHKAWND